MIDELLIEGAECFIIFVFKGISFRGKALAIVRELEQTSGGLDGILGFF